MNGAYGFSSWLNRVQSLIPMADFDDMAERRPVAGAALGVPATPIVQRTASGFAWTIAQTIGSKGAQLAMQMTLAWFLSEEDFSLIALATTVAAFAGMVQQVGLREILVQRQRKFHLWAGPAISLSVVVGIGALVLMCVAAPVAGVIFHSKELVGLTFVLAAGLPFYSLSLVPLARLQSQLRFRLIAWVTLWVTIGTSALTILLAWRGMGAYSFVWPRSIGAAATLVAVWLAADLPTSHLAHWKRARFLLGDSGYLAATAVFMFLMVNGDYLALGLLRPKPVVGVYFFAFSLSTQTLAIVASNLASVLFPTLSQMDLNPDRQVGAMLRASRLLAIVGVPLCLLQAVVAAPAIRFIYREKWVAAIPVFQVLSIGMAFAMASPAAASLIQAQRRFSFYFKWTACLGTLYVVFAATGAALGGAVSTAVAVAIYYAIFGPLGIYVAVRPSGRGWRPVWNTLFLPLAIGAAATAVGLLISRNAPAPRSALLLRAALSTAAFAAVYLAGAMVFCRDSLHELVRMLRMLITARAARKRA
jgi:O-antigen/teichoic acid export membrane protein